MYGYIYKTTNLINGKIYIGQKKSKVFLGNKYLGSGYKLKAAIKKYGPDNFNVELLESCDDKDALNNLEIYYISKYDSRNSDIGYNLAKGGNVIGLSGEQHPFYGKHHTEEAKLKNSIAHIGRTAWNKGKTGVYSDETKKLMGIKNKDIKWYNNGTQNMLAYECPEGYVKGRINSEKQNEQLKLLHESLKGKPAWNSGKVGVYSDETKKLMGAKNIGRKISAEHKEKLRNINKGNTYTKGKKLSEETKKKISESLKGKNAGAKNGMYGKIPWNKKVKDEGV